MTQNRLIVADRLPLPFLLSLPDEAEHGKMHGGVPVLIFLHGLGEGVR